MQLNQLKVCGEWGCRKLSGYHSATTDWSAWRSSGNCHCHSWTNSNSIITTFFKKMVSPKANIWLEFKSGSTLEKTKFIKTKWMSASMQKFIQSNCGIDRLFYHQALSIESYKHIRETIMQRTKKQVKEYSEKECFWKLEDFCCHINDKRIMTCLPTCICGAISSKQSHHPYTCLLSMQMLLERNQYFEINFSLECQR